MLAGLWVVLHYVQTHIAKQPLVILLFPPLAVSASMYRPTGVRQTLLLLMLRADAGCRAQGHIECARTSCLRKQC